MNYYNEIKNELINNEINKKIKNYWVNKSDLNTYYNVGRILSDAGKHYGEGIIKKYSQRLTNELGKGYTTSALKRMRQFYIIIKKGATMSHQLMWSHYIEIITIENINEINYYIQITKNQNLSVRNLRDKIKNYEYQRLSEETKLKIIKKEHIGQIQVYMNYIDYNLKKITQDKTIGIIICKKDNHFIMEYYSDERIYRTTYAINNV